MARSSVASHSGRSTVSWFTHASSRRTRLLQMATFLSRPLAARHHPFEFFQFRQHLRGRCGRYLSLVGDVLHPEPLAISQIRIACSTCARRPENTERIERDKRFSEGGLSTYR